MLQSVVSLISRLSLFLRPIIVVVVVVVEIPVCDVAVETISVAIDTCMFDYFNHVFLVGEDLRFYLLVLFVVIRIYRGIS